MKGLTGAIKFNQHGLRSNFELEIVEMKKDGLLKVGTWTEENGVNFTRNYTESYSEIVESLQNKTLVVTTLFVSLERKKSWGTNRETDRRSNFEIFPESALLDVPGFAQADDRKRRLRGLRHRPDHGNRPDSK